MDAQRIINLIQERIAGASHNEQQSEQDYLNATTDAERIVAHLGSQISTSQRLVLQNLLDEINGTDEE